MKTAYFTFGQAHEHVVNGQMLNKNTVLKILANDPRQVMFDNFDSKWSRQYDEQPDMRLYPGGLFELDDLCNDV